MAAHYLEARFSLEQLLQGGEHERMVVDQHDTNRHLRDIQQRDSGLAAAQPFWAPARAVSTPAAPVASLYLEGITNIPDD